MPNYIFDTTETVHGRYVIPAASKAEANEKFKQGDSGEPTLFETIVVEEVEITEENA